MKFILGSGIVGLLARDILGPEWTIIPFYKSRFYAFNPSLADNFIIKNDEIHQYVRSSFGNIQSFPYKRAYSIRGMLYGKHDDGICSDWMNKTFGFNNADHIPYYLKNAMEFDVYDLRINQLYTSLLDKYMPDIKKGLEFGGLSKIVGHNLVFGGKTIEYEKIVSTIPLDVLAAGCGYDYGLQKKDAHFIHLYTNDLDFEGYNQTLVVDNVFPFYQVTNVAQNRYLFYFHEPLDNPGAFFMSLMRNFDILDGTSIKDYLVTGMMPKLDALEDLNIFSVGSYAQWDWCMDVGSCILRIIKYSQRDMKEKKPSLKI